MCAQLQVACRRELRQGDPFELYACFNGGWACDGCAARDLPTMYHDYGSGDYDLCEPCYVLYRQQLPAAHSQPRPARTITIAAAMAMAHDDDVDDEPLPVL